MKPTSTVLILISALLLTSPIAFAKKKKKTEDTALAVVVVPDSTGASKPSSLRFSGSLGYVYNTYESAMVSVAQHALMIKGAAQWNLPSVERVSLGFSGFYTLLPFNTTRYVNTSGNAFDVSMRFLGLNLRANYDTPWMTGPWNLQLALGWYLNTSFVQNDLFGYEWVNGPQIYPQVSYRLDEKRTLGGYVKFSPVMSGATRVLSPGTSFELAGGLYALFPAPFLQNHTAIVGLDYAYLSIKPQDLMVTANSASLTMGLQF